ncbi:MAG TPA: phosphoribosylformylglycinamidine cyclo-ligase [Alkalispirochaeta sp.]|nr:phosphoribosylformylglycinamidine cyclo-ligase [Alkalispirochaeta sp.]
MNDETVDYRSAGVDVAAGQQLVRDIGATVAATQGAEVLSNLGGFAGLYAIGSYRDPVLVSGTDGVGTKVELARAAGRLDTIGIDLVAMCVNDVICHGAKPLFFLDYIAVDDLSQVDAAALVSGVAEGCRRAGCALIGGETAEMPGIYRPGRFDLAGFAVGAVEREAIIDGSALEPGMAVVGLASSGFHSNGYSLLRKLFPATESTEATDGELDSMTTALRDGLLTPTRIYAAVLSAITAQCPVAGVAHITGGGWRENLPRLLGRRRAGETHPEQGPHPALRLEVDAAVVPLPQPIRSVMDTPLSPAEAYRTFNMGLGMALALPVEYAAEAISIAADHGIAAWEIGSVHVQPQNADPADPAIVIAGIPDEWQRSAYE